uniref:Uncharacterized protein n=1 Tax=Anguilla anguilla TaxID=7936 RepID=A0A0E9W4H5_ANGAN
MCLIEQAIRSKSG